VDAHSKRIHELRMRVGMVFQRFNLFSHRTALENVMEGPVHVRRLPAAQARKQARALLDKVGLAHRMNAYPSELSGGQQQRVAIARALITDPVLIVADEPTGDLDRASATDVLAMLQRMNAELGKTIIMVTHDAHAAGAAQSLVHLEKGELIDGHAG
ncbi:ABC transporter ATP-binding protein, partial [Escherichia coli]|uniref:ABC transporter ATP-binding protein n=1 Tax=Escherichia coli TaxID=562 RepID=UPI00128CDC30